MTLEPVPISERHQGSFLLDSLTVPVKTIASTDEQVLWEFQIAGRTLRQQSPILRVTSIVYFAPTANSKEAYFNFGYEQDPGGFILANELTSSPNDRIMCSTFTCWFGTASPDNVVIAQQSTILGQEGTASIVQPATVKEINLDLDNAILISITGLPGVAVANEIELRRLCLELLGIP